jgi:hypothetical protein
MYHREGPKGRGQFSIKIYFTDTEVVSVEWLYLAQEGDQLQAVLNTIINIRFS